MTEKHKAALLAIRAQAVAIIALADAMLAETDPDPEPEDDCPHSNRLNNEAMGGDKSFYCPDCKKTFTCPHDRTQDASTMGNPRRFCPDCGRIFEGDALSEIPEGES